MNTGSIFQPANTDDFLSMLRAGADAQHELSEQYLMETYHWAAEPGIPWGETMYNAYYPFVSATHDEIVINPEW